MQPESCELTRAGALNDVRLWHPRLRINRLLREMLHTLWSAEARLVVRVDLRQGPGRMRTPAFREMGQPETTDLRTWGAHEHINVKRDSRRRVRLGALEGW